MLVPPRDARQMAAVQWLLPAMAAFCWVTWLWSRPGIEVSHGASFGVAVAAGWVWAAYSGGISRYGRVHGLLAPWALAILWVWPLSTALLPKLVPRDSAALVDLIMAVAHALVLGAAGVWHASRASLKHEDRSLEWDGATVDVAARRVRSGKAHGSWTPAVAAAALSVPLYAFLRKSLSLPEQMAFAATLMNLIAFWLYAGPMGRVFGHGIRLWQLERRLGGAPFEHAAVREIETWRSRSWIYRHFSRQRSRS